MTGTGVTAPSASFQGSPTSGQAPLNVSFTDNSTGTITNRFWDFGDGSTTNVSATSVTHTYVGAGTNTVALTVTGPLGTNTQTRPGYITVTNPPAQLVVSPSNLRFAGVVTGQVSYLSFEVVNRGSQALTGTASTVAPFSISGGSPYGLAVGRTGVVSVAFSPSSEVSYSNVVTFLSNGGNSTNVVTGSGLTPAQLSVLPPVLAFGVSAVGSNLQASLSVTNFGGGPLTNGLAVVDSGPFTIVSGSPFTLGGFGGSSIVIQFAPTNAGVFSNSVIVSGNGVSVTNGVTGQGAVAPVANFTGAPTSGAIPLLVSFTDSSTGTITNRVWDWGDGTVTNTTVTALAHAYSAPGTNTVALTVSGPLGTNVLSRTAYIVVTNLGPVTITISYSTNQVHLVWSSGTLQSAGAVTGVYGDVTNAASPYTVPASSSPQFFRVRVR